MRKVVLLVLLLAVVLVASALPVAMADGSQRVFVEFMPGRGTGVRNAILAGGGEIHFRFNSINTYAATVPERALRGLARNPRVVSIEEDPLRYLAGDFADSEGDPYQEQVTPWGITAVQAPEAWAAGAMGEGIEVCIIDTGFGAHHLDLQVTVDGESQVDDRWDHDGYGHGTHVAGTITAVGSNEVGVVGVSPGNVDLFIVKIFDDAGEWVQKAHASNLMKAAELCAEHGSDIISMSLSGTKASRPEQRVFDRLYYEENILSVAAASNDGVSAYAYPASYDSVISVGAIDSTLTVADFSNFNDQVELAAPGVGVLSTLPYTQDVWLKVNDVEYPALSIEYAPYGTTSGILVDGGRCLTADADWSGRVVLCERGDVTFLDKVVNVEAGGGVAAVIYNNEPGDLLATLGEPGPTIPAVSLSQEVGWAVLELVGQQGEVQNGQPDYTGSGYEAWDGTSMATPHVSGVAALLWSYNSGWTNVEIREAMAETARDLGMPGRDAYYGFGLVQACAALNYLGVTCPVTEP